MEKAEIRDQLKQLLEDDDILKIGKEANALTKSFYDIYNKEQAALKEKEDKTGDKEKADTPEEATPEVEVITAGESVEIREIQKDSAEESTEEKTEEEETASASDPLDDEIQELIAEFRARRKAFREAKEAEEQKNLLLKKEILAELTDLVKGEENIGRAYTRIKEIHEQWKTIGNVPSDRYHDLQNDYSKLNELFYYNINIYKELRENDLKKNLILKQEIIVKLEELMKLKSIREINTQLTALRTKWDEVGPTFQNDWEAIRDSYWKNVAAVRKKIQDFYTNRNEKQQENLEKKKALIEEAKVVAANVTKTHKDWEKKTAEVLKLFDAWKKIGFATKEENDKIWEEFKSIFNDFFHQKRAYYKERKKAYNSNAETKKALIEKVKALQDSTDWKTSTNQIIRLQNDWKKAGHAGNRLEQQMWKEFRSACDQFFDNKKAHFAEQEKAFEANTGLKEAVIKKIEGFKPDKDNEANLEELKKLSEEYNAIGGVPTKERDRISKAYRTALDGQYNAMDIDPKEKEAILFRSKIASIKQSRNPEVLLDKERDHIRKKLSKLESEMIQIENNMGFFTKSKGAEKILSDMQAKVDGSKDEINALKGRLKLMREL
jgi:hypothetical protein